MSKPEYTEWEDDIANAVIESLLGFAIEYPLESEKELDALRSTMSGLAARCYNLGLAHMIINTGGDPGPFFDKLAADMEAES
jgi:hypothetical protein